MNGKLYFCVIGEQKCGTTWLFKNLVNHPEIYIPPKNKESAFFILDRPWLYNNKLENFKCGDLTPEYLCLGEPIAKKIAEHNPEMKIIIMLRHPIDRLISQYKMQINFMTEPYIELKKHSIYDAFMNDLPDDYDNQIRSLKNRSMYYQNISVYMKYFKREQIKFIFMEEIINDPTRVLDSVCQFLNIQTMYNENINKIIRPDISLGGQIKISDQIEDSKCLTQEQRTIILDMIKPEIDKLEKLLGVNLDEYKK